MIGAVLNVGAVLLGLALTAIWIHAIVNWDGEWNCDHDCDTCPFTRCQDKKGENDK